ncbi:carbohydrate sulfotransferase 11-like [Macrosteles quadrilineatus]|uniref:carbohydrate sulfotransferase 11-like n=1 Tax=Macrosteles quadrilineatus TaxID=74068 RepID=UPI0023E20209|nr:carbohydrate sulfotransferase 11-like [Macrosteles quadrilineatus]XP_054280596.1 carbohydrate sulfotransferase 11-like [Macrosteles quadrilineatus]
MNKSRILRIGLLCILVFCFLTVYIYKKVLNERKLDKKIYSDKWSHDQTIYTNRQEYVNRLCKKFLNNSSEVEKIDLILNNRELLEHILVDSKHKVLYCYVPKVACTNWKRVFMVMIGMTKTSDILAIPPSTVHQQHYIPSLINFTSAQVQGMLRTYTKFIFVRHPFERLVSAYRNKFEQQYNSSKYFHNRFGRKIVKIFRNNPSPLSLLNGDDVTFAEFVAYLTSKNSVFNEHWMPINKLCEPCLVNYDFIGKYETLNVDAQYFLNYVGSDILFPRIKPTNTSSLVTKSMSQLPYNSIISLYKIYYNDFKLFQYSLQSYLGYELE